MKYELIVFDLDGTLADTRGDLANAVNVMRRHFSLEELSLETIVSFVGDGATKLVERSLVDTNIDLADGLAVMLEAYSQDICVDTVLYSGCVSFLERLKEQGIKLAILTNKPLEMTLEITKLLKIDHLFNPIISPENAACHKPETGGMLKCLSENNISADKALMVGDHHTDLRVAANAGVDSAFFTGGMGRTDGLTSAYTFESYADLAQQLS